MMLAASPFLPTMFSTQHNGDESTHFRPAKDMEAFNALLPPPIEFIEGSSSGTLAVAEGKYEAINASPKIVKAELKDSTKAAAAPAPKSPAPAPRSTNAKSPSLYPGAIDLKWPETCSRGQGLHNQGNTCFLNSALQCLLHTPPLLKLLLAHKEECKVKNGAFCMCCILRSIVVRSHTGSTPFNPSPVVNNLSVIAKHMRKGRQEDAHEFLRYAVDGLQKSCLTGTPPKLDVKIQETTWVHKLFGGRLRSRVSCKNCDHNSDTFDRILDLSLDIYKCESLKEALRKFVAIDYLKGADKYKCEKCKKHVNAEKRFTVHEAPLVLTVHLKRFTPMGRKLTQGVQYDSEISLQPYMSVGQFGPTYSLYGVICHAGGGPNSGHYYAFVKSKEGRWFEMNDDMVQAQGAPMNKKNAYMLFYIQNKGQNLEAAVKAPLANGNALSTRNANQSSTPAKRKAPTSDTEDEDQGVKLETPFIGPLLPSPQINGSSSKSVEPSRPDPQSLALKAKIEALKKTQAKDTLNSLAKYASDSDSDDDKDDDDKPKGPASSSPAKPAADEDHEMDDETDKVEPRKGGNASSPGPARPSSPTPAPPASEPPSSGIPPTRFYSSLNKKKRKHMADRENDRGSRGGGPIEARSRGYSTASPYGNKFNKLNVKRKKMGI